MKKIPLLITLSLIIAIAGGYFLYNTYLSKSNTTPWDIVPESTIFVYEANDCKECVEKLQQTSLWSIFREAAFYEKGIDSLQLLFTFLDSQYDGQLVSTHLTKKDDFDFVFYVPFSKSKSKDLLLNAWRKFGTSKRVFNETEIHEIKYKGQLFSWAEIDEIWVGSFTPFLLEDVIRTHNLDDGSTFKNRIKSVYQLPRIKKDAGNIYVHIKNFGDWLSSFSNEAPELVKQIGQSAILDIKTDDKNFVLNGFSLDSAYQKYILSIFNEQIPVAFDLKNLISNRSITFANYGISNGNSFAEGLKKYWAVKNPNLLDSIQQLNASSGLQLANLYKSLGKEVGVCLLEGKREELTRILIIDSKNPTEWINTFNAIAEKTSVDTVFYERYSDYEIREIPVYNFPEKLFWPLVSGFKTSYYTLLGNRIIIGEDVNELKGFLNDIDQEETWGKSVAQNKFLETTLLEANVSVYVNTPLIWNVITKMLHPKWQTFVKENSSQLKTLGMGAIQMSHLNESYYTNITWRFSPETNIEEKQQEQKSRFVTNLNKGVHKLFIVKNHTTKKDEIVIQDSTYALSLLEADGKVLWSVPLTSYIAGDIAQIDFLNNGKLQLFFATPGELHVIDRLGNYVKPYPLKIQENDIEYVSIIDYDHSKKYRFLVTSKSGSLWMYDKDGTNLEGWTPKNIEGDLFTAPQHHRLRGKDYIVAIRRDGYAYLMNRRGETIPNFPLNLDARPEGNYFVETGNSLTNTNFVIVSRHGFRTKFNLQGKIQSKETLLKTSADARFSLIAEVNNKSYLIARQEAKHLTLFTQNVDEFIVSDFIGNNPSVINYYDFGSGKMYVAVSDLSQELSFIYDAQGTLLTPIPIESQSIILRYPTGDKLKAYSFLQKAIAVDTF